MRLVTSTTSVRQTDGGERVHEHTGSGGTFHAWIALYPDSDLGVVLLTNCGFHAKPFLKEMRDAIHRRMAQAPRSSSVGD